MSSAKTLVLGASGFLGSHVTRALVARGRAVRALVRPTSDTRGIDDLEVERCYGDVCDQASLDRAVRGCDVVYCCVLDPRAWLHDPSPLYRVNLLGLSNVLAAVRAHPVRRFIYTSTITTIGLNPTGVASEADVFNWWDRAPPYVRMRVLAEERVLAAARDEGVGAVACCVGTTFGARDYQPTPHGQLIRQVVAGRMPVWWQGGLSVVGITEAADGLLLAEEHGRIGERYILTQRYMTQRELAGVAASSAGVAPPWLYLPSPLMSLTCAVAGAATALTGHDTQLTPTSLSLMNTMADFTNRKARHDLHWNPRPIQSSIAEAVRWFREQGP